MTDDIHIHRRTDHATVTSVTEEESLSVLGNKIGVVAFFHFNRDASCEPL